jgi:Tfp pilus assembly protein PilN
MSSSPYWAEFTVPHSDLNLSTRPFPAYRLISLALGFVFVVLLVISVWQAWGFVQFTSMARDIRDDEQTARVEAESSGRHAAELKSRLDRPEETAKLNEIGFLNGLIARKELSWTRLFSNLEDMVPESVHLVSLRPDVKDGAVVLSLQIVGRSIADISRFIEALERSPEFENVVVSVEEKGDPAAATDVNVSLTANYFPQREIR